MSKINPQKPNQGNILSQSPILGVNSVPKKKEPRTISAPSSTGIARAKNVTAVSMPRTATGITAPKYTTSITTNRIKTGAVTTGITSPKYSKGITSNKIATGITATSITTPKSLIGGGLLKVTGLTATASKISEKTTPSTTFDKGKVAKAKTGVTTSIAPMPSAPTPKQDKQFAKPVIGKAWSTGTSNLAGGVSTGVFATGGISTGVIGTSWSYSGS